jgi:ABC-type phosphate transport system auxiliary subunit
MRILIPLVLLFGLSVEASAETHNMQEPINVDGQYSRRVTAAEKLKRQRKLLEARNEAMVKKTIEAIRLKQEIELMKRMQKTFEQNLENLENI